MTCATITHHLLNSLNGLAGQLRSQTPTQALATLHALSTEVQQLENLTTQVAARARQHSDLYEQHLEAVETLLNRSYQDQQAMEAQVRDMNAELERVRQEDSLTRQHIEALNQQLDQLRNHLRELHERAEKLKKWCWVPGYGAYLAVRTLVDDDQGRFNSAVREMQRFQDDRGNSEQRMHHLYNVVRELEVARDSVNNRVAAAEQLRQGLQQKRELSKSKVVLCSQASLGARLLGQRLQALTRRLQDGADLLELDADEAGRELLFLHGVPADLSQNLLQFGSYADELLSAALPQLSLRRSSAAAEPASEAAFATAGAAGLAAAAQLLAAQPADEAGAAAIDSPFAEAIAADLSLA